MRAVHDALLPSTLYLAASDLFMRVVMLSCDWRKCVAMSLAHSLPFVANDFAI